MQKKIVCEESIYVFNNFRKLSYDNQIKNQMNEMLLQINYSVKSYSRRFITNRL